jgi:murein DD-endopeptidase MepM/ murein hydrolase activator NlpD
MLPTPDEEDIPLRHRPLPSVDIALLPHELRAIRMQRRAIGAGALGIVLLVVGLAWGKTLLARLEGARQQHGWGGAPAGSSSTSTLAATGTAAAGASARHSVTLAAQGRRTPPAVAALPRPIVVTTRVTTESSPGDGALSRVETKFGSAKSFHQALLVSGASPAEAWELITALQKLVDFRRGKPEDRFVFERDSDKQLRSFEYRASITEVYRAVRNEAGALRGLRVEIPIEKRRVAKGTFIGGTLGHSLTALGLAPYLVGIVTEALDARISFTKDTRAGDSVKLIVDEEYVDGAFLRYGAVHAIEYASERAGKLQAFWFEPDSHEGDFYDPNGRALHGGWLRTPLRYDYISSPYNLKRRHPILKRVVPHLGIDYSASTGTPVGAAADGLVTFAATRGPNGNLVSLRHPNGYETHYAHLSKIAPNIKPGIKLKQRQVLGFVGSTGRSTGPHLHFAVKRSGHFVDPASVLNGPGEPLTGALQIRFRATTQHLREELERIPLAPAPSVEGDADKTDDSADEDDVDL